MNELVWPLHEISDTANALVVEFFNANKQEARLKARSLSARWVPPKVDFYKVNYDAAIFESLGYAGLGVVIRDCTDNVIAELSQKIGLPHSVETAEALAAFRAVVFAKELSIFKVVVEGDCLKVVQALKAKERCNTLYGTVIEDAHSQGVSLQACQFQHVRREGNKLAHALARRAISSADFDVWVEELPSDLEDVFLSDFSVLA